MTSASDERDSHPEHHEPGGLSTDLLSAIDEEVDKARLSTPPGEQPIEISVGYARPPAENMIARMARKPRTMALLLLLLIATLIFAVQWWSDQKNQEIDRQRAGQMRGQPTLLVK